MKASSIETPRDRISLSLFSAGLLIYILANFLPAVSVNTSWGGSHGTPNYNPVIGFLCTLVHPSGWTVLVLHFISIAVFTNFWCYKKSFLKWFLILPFGVIIYMLYTSYELISADSNNELLIGHYCWLLSVVLVSAFFIRLTNVSTKDRPSPETSQSR